MSSCGYHDLIERQEEATLNWDKTFLRYTQRAEILKKITLIRSDHLSRELQFELDETLGIKSIDTKDAVQFQDFVRRQNRISEKVTALSESLKRHKELWNELKGADYRIGIARGRYSRAVFSLNRMLHQFPTNFLGKYLLKLSPLENFRIGEEAQLASHRVNPKQSTLP